MPTNQYNHYLKHSHIYTQATLAHTPLISYARMPHQQRTPPHICSLSTPCSTTPCRNSCMPHQHHMHCPLAPHAHIQLDTPNNQLVFTFCVQQAFLLLLRNSSLPQISSFLLRIIFVRPQGCVLLVLELTSLLVLHVIFSQHNVFSIKIIFVLLSCYNSILHKRYK